MEERGDEAVGHNASHVDLPYEVWLHVFRFLEPVHAMSAVLTCHRWRTIINSEHSLWRACHERFLGGPRVPAVLSAPAVPPDCQWLEYAPSLVQLLNKLRSKGMRADGQGAFDGEQGWRQAVQLKAKWVRKWGRGPAGQMEWAARLGCDRLLIRLVAKHQEELATAGEWQIALRSALGAAIHANSLECAGVMTRHGAVMYQHDIDFSRAILWDNWRMVQLLHKHRSSMFLSVKPTVATACEVGAAEVMRYMIRIRRRKVLFLLNLVLCLNSAARRGHLELIRVAFSAFSVSELSPAADQALLAAAKSSQNEVIELLLDIGVPSRKWLIQAYFSSPHPETSVLMRLIRGIPEVAVAEGGPLSPRTDHFVGWLSGEEHEQVHELLRARGMELSLLLQKEADECFMEG